MRKQTVFIGTTVLDTTKRKYTVAINRDKYLHSINLQFRGRHRVTGAATTVLPEGIINLVERVRLRMVHEIFGSDTLFDMYGPSLYAYRNFHNGVPDRSNLSIPLTIQLAEADYDFRLQLYLPPEGVFGQDQEKYLLDAPRCSLLELDVEWGNAASAVEGGTTSLTNFGGTTGTPEMDVEIVQVLDKEDLPYTALIKRQSLEFTIDAAVTNDRLRELPTGEAVRCYMLKQYTRSTTAGQPTSVAATLLDPVEPDIDTGITRVGISVNERYIQQYRGWQQLRAKNLAEYRAIGLPTGYGIIDFVEDGNIDNALFTQDFIERRMRLALFGTVIAAANNRCELTITSIKPNPQLA